MNRRPRLVLCSAVALSAPTFLLFASVALAQDVDASGTNRVPARAGQFSLKLEPGVAVPLTSPQSRLFDVGGGATLKGMFALDPSWDIGPSLTFIELPAADSAAQAGTAWNFGGSVRFKRAHHLGNDNLSAISPWVDLDALYVRTDQLNRPGFAAAVGVAVPIGAEQNFWLGPFVRYFQIIQGTPSGFDNHDARILSVGLSLEVGSSVKREPRVPTTSAPVEPMSSAEICADRDKDGILDNIDRCPSVVGPADSWGCPVYQKLVIKKDKLELKEKLYFAWDQATLQEESYPALDEVVQALKDNPEFRVQVEGHSSSEGGDDHNQTLSEKRASAVVAYLASHGIAEERLASKGFASSVPTDTNETVVGRENNRRVEFVVYFTILEGRSQ